MNKPKVYLAGKINGSNFDLQRQGEFQDWRWPLVGIGLFNYSEVGPTTLDFLYQGPFYIPEKSHYGFQDPNCHGAGANYMDTQDECVTSCLRGIMNSDIVFAWLNTKDAHGTLMEIAYACSEGKDVTLVVPPCDCDVSKLCIWDHTCVFGDCGVSESYTSDHTCVYGEVWFAQALVRNQFGTVIYSNDPVEEFHKVIARWNRSNQQFNSVPEKEFWNRAIYDYKRGLLYRDIVSQHPVGKYRIDFAIPELKFGIEIDGLAYHNGQDSFMKDRSRQREIESQGWRIVRFAAKEISLDVNKCFWEAEAIALELSQALVGAK